MKSKLRGLDGESRRGRSLPVLPRSSPRSSSRVDVTDAKSSHLIMESERDDFESFFAENMSCIARSISRSARFTSLPSLTNNTAVPRHILGPLFQRSFTHSTGIMSNLNLTTLDVC